MKRIATLAAALIVLATGLPAAHAAVIVNDNFEYANQAAFEGTWTPIGTVAPISAVLSSAQSSSPTKSVQSPGTATSSQYRNRASFTETSTFSTSGNLGIGDQLIWSFDFYDSVPTGSPQRNHNNLQDGTGPTATNQLVAMGFNNNQTGANSGGQYYMGRILGYTVPVTPDPDGGPTESVGGAGAFFKLNDFGTPNRSLGWHNLKVILSTDDGLSTDYSFYVDNVLRELVSNVGTAASIRSYDKLVIGSGLSNGNVEAFTDNAYVEYIPANSPPTVVDAIYGPPYNANEPGAPQTLTHQFTATDTQTPAGPFTWDMLSLLSYTPNYGGVGPGPALAATLSGTGQFDWVSEGSPRGDYVWEVRGTDPGGLSDKGTITVRVTNVPEPASLALCGLALAGMSLAARRRMS